MKSRKSTLFLMEQVIVIAVFAICAAICVSILTSSYLMTRNALDTRNALMIAESAAESHKAFGGDITRIADILGGTADLDSNTFTIYYDTNWQPVNAEDASFVLNFTMRDDTLVIFSDVSVSTNAGSELVSLTAAVRRSGL